MLVEFSVKNFMSIKDEVTFSMVAGSGDENLENIIENKITGEKYLKTTAIYGANASGKTSFMRALTAGILAVRRSNLRNINEPIIEMIPFKFDKKNINEPCEFKFVFIKNNIKYIYGFSADVNRIYTEYLYQYLSAKPSLIFERTNVNEYKFSQADQRKLSELANKNTEKKLFLATATTWNYEKTKDVYIWFSEDIDTYSDYMRIGGYAFDKFEKDEDEKLKRFTINLLKEADILIKDYDFQVEKIMPNELEAFENQKNLEGNFIKKEVKISTLHEIEKENGEKEEYQLDLLEESLGTQSLFFFSPVLKEAFEKGKVVVIDEIDKSLHPLLVEFIVKLFHNSKINKNNAQLIFTTHDTNLLSLDNFRRDQIWFAEKEPKKGTTDLYPLDDFSVRKTENIQKGYLNGRYGAIPFLNIGNSLWED